MRSAPAGTAEYFVAPEGETVAVSRRAQALQDATPRNEIIPREKARVKRHIASIAACGTDRSSEGPRIVVIENLIRENVAIFDFRFHQVLIASKPAPRYRIRHLYFLFAGEVRPRNPQRVAGSLVSQISNLWPVMLEG